MKHNEIETGMLRAYLDGEVDGDRISALTEHVSTCSECQAELKVLTGYAASVRAGLDYLPQPVAAGVAPAWSAMRLRLEQPAASAPTRWSPWRTWSLAAGGVAAIAAVIAFSVAPVQGWAENLLSIFRMEHIAVVELNPDAVNALENDQLMSRMISADVTQTEAPQKPQPVADAATASKLAGFQIHLIGGETPALLLFRTPISAQMKLDRDRLQSILDEAGRSDVQIPRSADGAVIGMRVPAGIIAVYGNCGDASERLQRKQRPASALHPEDGSCVRLNEVPSPTVTAPQELDTAEIVRAALQFAGLSATEAANFTQTIDWTSTFVMPILRGQLSYEKVSVGGNDGVLLRPKNQQSGQFTLHWVDSGILYSLMGSGDNTTALNLAAQIE